MKQLTTRLGEQKISKLLVNLSVPATIGMMVNALYNLVDTIFVGRGVGAALFQSLGKAVPSLILALLRQVLLFIPLVIILPRVLGLGLWGIWIAYPAADILSVVLTVLFLRSELKKMSLSMW